MVGLRRKAASVARHAAHRTRWGFSCRLFYGVRKHCHPFCSELSQPISVTVNAIGVHANPGRREKRPRRRLIARNRARLVERKSRKEHARRRPPNNNSTSRAARRSGAGKRGGNREKDAERWDRSSNVFIEYTGSRNVPEIPPLPLNRPGITEVTIMIHRGTALPISSIVLEMCHAFFMILQLSYRPPI